MSLPVAVATAALTASRPAGVRVVVVVVGREGGVRGRRSSSSPANQPTPWASSVGAFFIYFFILLGWWGFHKNSAAASCWNVIPDSKKNKGKEKKKAKWNPADLFLSFRFAFHLLLAVCSALITAVNVSYEHM